MGPRRSWASGWSRTRALSSGCGSERTQEPRHRGHPAGRRRWPEGLPGRDTRRVPRSDGPDLHCPSAASQPRLRLLQGPQGRRGRAEGIYRAVDAAAGEVALGALEDSLLGRRYPAIGQSWRRAWAEVVRSMPFWPMSAPSSQELGPPTNLGRFKVKHLGSIFSATAHCSPTAGACVTRPASRAAPVGDDVL